MKNNFQSIIFYENKLKKYCKLIITVLIRIFFEIFIYQFLIFFNFKKYTLSHPYNIFYVKDKF